LSQIVEPVLECTDVHRKLKQLLSGIVVEVWRPDIVLISSALESLSGLVVLSKLTQVGYEIITRFLKERVLVAEFGKDFFTLRLSTNGCVLDISERVLPGTSNQVGLPDICSEADIAHFHLNVHELDNDIRRKLHIRKLSVDPSCE
jgi:hypothetical protein